MLSINGHLHRNPITGPHNKYHGVWVTQYGGLELGVILLQLLLLMFVFL